MTTANDKYEGLNLPQLLDLMHDIVVPEAISLTPQTVGWQIAGCWAIAVAALSLIKYAQYRRRNRYRREALELIDQVDTGSDNPAAAGEIATIVKRTALVAYARDDVASLAGAEWARFLIESSGNDSRVKASAPMIAAAAYRMDVDAIKLVKPARRWVKAHRA